jgi:Domain of unknown function (DUF397)
MIHDLSAAAWRKSTRSGQQGQCVEVANLAAAWRKSTRSSQQGQCVEVADLTGAVAVRDSKNPGGGAVVVSAAQWRLFIARIKTDG